MPTPSEVIAMGVVMPLADGGILLLRYLARRRTGKYGIDDYLILFAYITSLSLGALLIVGAVRYDYGLNGPATTAGSGYIAYGKGLVHTKRITNIIDFIQFWPLGASKLSCIFFYRRIFRGQAFDIVSWTTSFVVLAWMLASFFLILLQCGKHVDWLWTSAEHIAANCMSGVKIALFYSSVDVVVDIVIIIIPIYWVSKTLTSRTKKFLVCCVFLFGALAVLSSVVRLVVFIVIYPGHNSTPNQYAWLTDVAYFSMLEIGLGIIAACLPTLGPLLTDAQRHRFRNTVGAFFPGNRGSQISGFQPYLSFRGLRPKPLLSGSVSGTPFVLKESTETRPDLETFVMGDIERALGHSDRIPTARDGAHVSSDI
ncbi:hypothetical protein EV356DRAFT_386320 [Viridothelium virens]|uniref:Rhodopsin domain-containing protein n=1 Tax=Viridothelium virens TaxID=1048519 RepID=A0A6A6GVX4_VIRVR|nr:hypothetical protein EV356DRAFT_386320 [Viridothelium virens]